MRVLSGMNFLLRALTGDTMPGTNDSAGAHPPELMYPNAPLQGVKPSAIAVLDDSCRSCPRPWRRSSIWRLWEDERFRG
jgi:hypothetical protein